MDIVKAAIGWLIKLPDVIVCAIVDSIILAMTGNQNFPTPSPTLAAVITANDAAKAALAAAANGGKVLTALKNAAMAQLAVVVRPLGYYVTITAAGDMAKLLSSGFPIQQANRPEIGPLPTPVTPVVRPGDHFGKIIAATEAIRGAYIYNWRVTAADAPTVIVLERQTTRANVELIGLVRGQIYNVQVSAVGAAGETEWSNAANITAP